MPVLSVITVAFMVVVAALLLLRTLAGAFGLIDKPGGRKMHQGHIPVVGGLAMTVGFVMASVAAGRLPHSQFVLLLLGVFMAGLGALDDRFDVPPKVRLFAHVSAALVLVFGTQTTVGSLGDLLGWGDLQLGWFATPFTVVAVVALINAYNMLDGLDGLAAGCGLVALGGMLWIGGAAGGAPGLTLIGALFGAVVGFALFNMPLHFNKPLRTFMGDAGSTLLGFLLAGLSLSFIQPHADGSTIAPVTILWLMPLPIFELFGTTVRRLVQGIPLAVADAGHFHHRLADKGLSVRAICALYVLVSLGSAVAGIYMASHGVPQQIMFLGYLLLAGLWMALLSQAQVIAQAGPAWVRRPTHTGY